MDAPILWKSKGQTTIALSSAEAEYYALTEAAKEVKFVVQLLQSMGVTVQTPVTVYVDNIGAIYMADNEVSSGRTKHIDIRHHFIREMVMDEFLKIKFVRSEQNRSDIFTKNTTQQVHKEHTPTMIRSLSSLENENEN